MKRNIGRPAPQELAVHELYVILLQINNSQVQTVVTVLLPKFLVACQRIVTGLVNKIQAPVTMLVMTGHHVRGVAL
jgi:hypothetical protein